VFACSKGARDLEAKPTIPYLLAFPEFKQLGEGIEPEAAPDHARYERLRATLDAIIAQDARLAHLRAAGERVSRFSAS
jgi:hypothetical protein